MKRNETAIDRIRSYAPERIHNIDTRQLEAFPPNLDTMGRDDLWSFWSTTKGVRPVKAARELFPARPKGYVTAFKDLGFYAANKATAISCRLAGDVDTALMYENIADSIYSDLPEFARW